MRGTKPAPRGGPQKKTERPGLTADEIE